MRIHYSQMTDDDWLVAINGHIFGPDESYSDGDTLTFPADELPENQRDFVFVTDHWELAEQ